MNNVPPDPPLWPFVRTLAISLGLAVLIAALCLATIGQPEEMPMAIFLLFVGVILGIVGFVR